MPVMLRRAVYCISVADPGFNVWGVDPLGGGVDLPTRVLFGENVCQNERIGSRRGACAGHEPLDPPMH